MSVETNLTEQHCHRRRITATVPLPPTHNHFTASCDRRGDIRGFKLDDELNLIKCFNVLFKNGQTEI